MVKPKNHTTPHTTNPDYGIEMVSRNPGHKDDMNLLRGWTPNFLRTTCFVKKHKKGLKKTQANSVKAVSAHAEAIKAPVKPKLCCVRGSWSAGACNLSRTLAPPCLKQTASPHPRIPACVCWDPEQGPRSLSEVLPAGAALGLLRDVKAEQGAPPLAARPRALHPARPS
ncbi:60S ribosomal protein L29-like [Onychomys torridus]|uniref:60S ribosomal protein L29-like n=1 Tax=Onychomys torridus TaxID=38674 RepID=UPI00167F3948|nr:60S ribosomal protein L29-like [Onychomys torridus]